MPRPKKCRKVCFLPPADIFSANGETDECIILHVDEYECIRLVDYEGYSQEQCAACMQVSRATAQLICERARKKIAAALVNGCTLRIEGGEYRLCDGSEKRCGCSGCPKQAHSQIQSMKEGDFKMKIAVTYENEQIFQHFGHTSQLKIYDVENSQIVGTNVVDTNGQGHGALVSFLKYLQVDILICGGIGGGAQMALADAGIQLLGGVSGSCDAAVEAWLAGNLAYNPDVRCNHHDHEHGEEHHTCGEHGCGGHSCHR